jgi:transposase, IS5 family
VDSEQRSFTDVEYGNRRRVSRREQFLVAMDATIPWARWVGLIERYYYSAGPGKKGRKAKPIETMLRMYLLQVWFALSDEGVEDAVYDSYAMCRFMGLDFAVTQVPDATTLLHFRHLLEKHQLGEKLFAAQNEIFDEQGSAPTGAPTPYRHPAAGPPPPRPRSATGSHLRRSGSPHTSGSRPRRRAQPGTNHRPLTACRSCHHGSFGRSQPRPDRRPNSALSVGDECVRVTLVG